MKRSLRSVSLVLALAVLLASAAIAVGAQKPAYIKKSLDAYIYSLDKKDTIACLFFDALPNEPYIDAVDFLKNAYVFDYTVSAQGGKITVANEVGKMVCDPSTDAVWFDDFYSFVFFGANVEGTSLECDYLDWVEDRRSSDDVDATLDLSKYGFDIVAVDGRIYFPLTLISDIFIDSYNAAVYANGNIYFVHALDDENYFDSSESYNVQTRDARIVDYTYRTLCFMFDTFYGAPGNALLAKSIAAKGFDRTLDEYDEATRLAKSLLLSTDLTDYFAGLIILYPYLDDGGHTYLLYEPFTALSLYPDSEFAKKLTAILGSNGALSPRDAAVVRVIEDYNASFDRDAPIFDAWNKADLDFVDSWDDDGEMLFRKGETALFVFDSFENGVVDAFNRSLEWAKENGIKNFVLDISTNSGGSTSVLEYLLTIILAGKTHSALSETTTLETVTGVEYTTVNRVDLNRDGSFDEKDDKVGYDFNFAILTSHMSFSCANGLPMLAKENGVAILGERSGGGSCIITEPFVGASHYITMSSNLKYVVKSGADFDLGAALDFDLTRTDSNGSVDYSALFDLNLIGALLRNFYDHAGDANGDGKVNAKDVVAAMKFIVGIVPAAFNKKLADFNGDDVVNARDVVAIMKVIVAIR